MAKDVKRYRVEDLKRYNSHLTTQQIEQLEELAEATGVSKAAHLRMALAEYLRRERKKLARQRA
jgi:predicted transcriptional regulator